MEFSELPTKIPNNIQQLLTDVSADLYGDSHLTSEDYPGFSTGIDLLREWFYDYPTLYLEEWSGCVVTEFHEENASDYREVDLLDSLGYKEIKRYL